MLLSQDKNVLYVAVPKTGTTAIQQWLQKEDRSFIKGRHDVKGKTVVLKEHITAQEAKDLLGDRYFDTLKVIGFIRHPYSKMVSAYNFYRQGGKNKSIWSGKSKNRLLRIRQTVSKLSAFALPFWIWIFVYPYRDNKRYFVGKNGKIIVTHIGRYEYFLNDIKLIINDMQLNVDINNLKAINVSKKRAKINVLNNRLIQRLLFIRHRNLKPDLEFYSKINSSLKSWN